jgi:Cu2+-exporting ATPase
MLLSIALLVGSAYVIARRGYGTKGMKQAKRIINQKHLKQTLSTVAVKKTANNESDQDQADKKINRNIAISATSLGVALSSATFMPVLQPLAWLGFLYIASPFFKEGYHAIVKQRKVNMAAVDVIILTGLIAMGSVITGTLMCTLLWSAQKILRKTEDRSRQSLINVFGHQPRSVWVLKDDVEIEIPFADLQAGDELLINAGETIPADGTISSGIASIDQQALTGESQPVEKTVGDAVFAATLLLSGKIQLRVEKAGVDSVAMQISDALLKTADFKSITQTRWVERVDKSAPITLAVGVAALPVLGPSSAVSLLYSCTYGYSMRIIAPATMMNFLTLSSHRGLLIKDGRSLELLDQIDTIVFDKTGTLTLEQPEVAVIHPTLNYSTETVLRYAATAEYRQTHPIARAILHAAKQQAVSPLEIDHANYELGYGICVQLEDKTIRVGSQRFMQLSNITLPAEMAEIEQRCHENGHSLVMVAVDQQLAGVIELHTMVRPEAKQVIDALKQRGMTLYIISGDHEKPTQRLANSLGIPHYFAETLPAKKADLIAQLQHEGKKVCFIGDGINDAIALKKANVSISMSGATAIATDTAQIVLMDGSLKQLITLFDLAKQHKHTVDRSFLMTLVPTSIAIGGIVFLNFGIAASVILYYSGLVAGMGNATLPLFKKEKK